MNDENLNLAVIVGSTREGRFGPVVANWLAGQARQHDGMDVDVIDLAEARLPGELSKAPTPEVTAVTERLEAADAFVVVTPEYNHSFPASLKTVIDWHYTEWQAKPVGFVSYGGLAGGLRAVEHLRVVFAELHAVTIRDTVSFHGVWGQFNDSGRLLNPDGPNAAAKTMLDQLAWWGFTLREARATHPYRT
ncbi:MAG TPA: NAD(P)H-dependent oxidoreductase [Amycolatopsis sp.]|uniref:NADPH-dependent FMN reductase n=1 Tax=Amycolatopsis sp. TaxID=37632 RepID=UPI002B45D4E3|nr:NAD(P)H-dependent oxidoreductase [Amycolatopsis sp.]HKS43614.1 NAD(P)H-dependent oxidoreductase [Amycolatopsis sp.]